MLREQNVELVAAVHDHVDRSVMPGDRGHLAHSRGEACAVGLLLAQFVLVELPDPAMLFENRAGILAGDTGLAILRLAGVRRRAYVHIQRSLAIEGDALVAMLIHTFKTGDDNFGRAGGFQLAGRHFVALDRVHLGYIEIAVVKLDTGDGPIAELLPELQIARRHWRS